MKRICLTTGWFFTGGNRNIRGAELLGVIVSVLLALFILCSCAAPPTVTPMADVTPAKTSNRQISQHIQKTRTHLQNIQTSQKVESASLQTVMDDLNKLLGETK